MKSEDEEMVAHYRPESDMFQLERPGGARGEPQEWGEWACRPTANGAETFIRDVTGEIWHGGDKGD